MAPRHALTFEAGLHDGSGTPRAIHSKGAEQTLGPACPMMMRAHIQLTIFTITPPPHLSVIDACTQHTALFVYTIEAVG